MTRGNRPTPRRFRPGLDHLEPRALLSSGFFSGSSSSSSSYQNAVAKHAYDNFVADLRRVELSSLATPAQYLALRDDARAISQAISASPGTSHGPSVQNQMIAATLLIDRSLLQGWLGDQGWGEIRSRLGVDLAGLNVPGALLDKTVGDMKSAAVSAGVDPGTQDVLAGEISSVQSARNQLYGGSSNASYRDPQVYYTQHLRGFFRGWAQQKTSDTAQLQQTLASLGGGTSAGNVLRRDVSTLQAIGAPLPSDTFASFTGEYVAAFAQGAPTPASLGSFRSAAIQELGPAATPPVASKIDRLIRDAPSFYAAAGSLLNVETLVNEARAVVDDGQGSSLNPFLIVVRP